MLHANQVQAVQDHVPFSISVPEGARLQPIAIPAEESLAATARPVRPYEINVSGLQVLLAFLSGLGSIGLLVWAVIKLWLFGG
jgi:hypothetical protein